MEDDPEREPHPEGFRKVKAQRAHGCGHDGEQHRVDHGNALGDHRGQWRGRHGRNAAHGRIHADQRRGNSALFKNDAQEWQAKPHGDADGGNRGNRSNQRGPVNVFALGRGYGHLFH